MSASYALHLNVSALVIWLPFTKDTFDVLQTDNVDNGHTDSGQRTADMGRTWKRGQLCCRHSDVSVASLSDSWQPVDHRIVPCYVPCIFYETLSVLSVPSGAVCELHKYLPAKGKN